MDTRRKNYVLDIDNEEPLLVSSSFQLLQDKQKQARYSSGMPTLAWSHTFALTSIE